MIRFFMSFCCFAIILISQEKLLALSSEGASIAITHSNIVAVWQSQDELGNVLVQGATGTIATINSLNVTTLSDGLNSVQNSKPKLAINADGLAVAIWEYVDATQNDRIAVSTLQNDGVAWNTATISGGDSVGGFFDREVAIDNTGNVIAYWSAYLAESGEDRVRGATAIMGPDGPIWGSPFSLSTN